MMNINLENILDAIKPLLWEAADGMMEIYNRQDFGTKEKVDKSPITEADLFSHNTLVKGLREITPQILVISEENKVFETIEETKPYWVIDPLDGTKEFIAQNGEFTINVALVQQSYPILGCVLAPVFNELYFAIQGKGAFVQTRGEKPTSIQAATYPRGAEDLRILCSRSHLNQKTEAYIEQFTSPNIIKKGGSMKFMDIAAGRADIYPRFGPTMEWDTCAPQIIVEEAGGQLIDQSTGQRMAYGKEGFLNNYFVVSAKEV